MASNSPPEKQTWAEAWDQAEGIHCDRCGRELFRVTKVRDRVICQRCLYKVRDLWLEEIICPTCQGVAAYLNSLQDGLLSVTLICPQCGVKKKGASL